MDQDSSEMGRQTILIIDDEPVNAHLIWQLVGEHEIIMAENGPDGIDMAVDQQPDLILLDINMPGMLGFEVCSRLRANPLTQKIPVIFITTMDAVEDKVRGFEVGGADYIVKPYSKEEVVARVNTHLLLRNLQIDLENRNRRLIEHKETLEKLSYAMSEANDRVYESLREASAGLDVPEDMQKFKNIFRNVIESIEEELNGGLFRHDS